MRTALITLAAAGAIVLAGGTATTTTARAAAEQAAATMHEQMTPMSSPAGMMDGGHMGAMHGEAGMAAMAGADMDAMHDRMHTEMRDAMPAELLERCDELHADMAADMADGDHAAHHPTD